MHSAACLSLSLNDVRRFYVPMEASTVPARNRWTSLRCATATSKTPPKIATSFFCTAPGRSADITTKQSRKVPFPFNPFPYSVSMHFSSEISNPQLEGHVKGFEFRLGIKDNLCRWCSHAIAHPFSCVAWDPNGSDLVRHTKLKNQRQVRTQGSNVIHRSLSVVGAAGPDMKRFGVSRSPAHRDISTLIVILRRKCQYKHGKNRKRTWSFLFLDASLAQSLSGSSVEHWCYHVSDMTSPV